MLATITVANRKGGVGKTTTAVALAETIAAAGTPTTIVDLDPQGSAAAWAALANASQQPLSCDVIQPPAGVTAVKLGSWVGDEFGKKRTLVFDTAAGDVDMQDAALELARHRRKGLALVPSKADRIDIDNTLTFLDGVTAKAPLVVLLVACDHRTKDPKNAREEYEAEQVEVLGNDVPGTVSITRELFQPLRHTGPLFKAYDDIRRELMANHG